MIEKRPRRGRDHKPYTVYRVRWRNDAGEERSRTFPRGTTRKQAEAFELRVMTLKRGGDLDALDAGRITLAAWAAYWWSSHAELDLAESTRTRYAEVWNTHALGPLGELRLREVKAPVLVAFRQMLERKGVGAPTIRKTFVVIQSMLARAVEEGQVPMNQAQLVRKPKQSRQHDPVVIAPLKIEQLRRNIIDADREGRGARDAVFVSVLAYAGPRPWSEAARLEWAAVLDTALDVYATKTSRQRHVDLLGPLRTDLAEYRIRLGRPASGALLFPGPQPDGTWTHSDKGNWRTRVWAPALKAVGLPESMVPYDLRHTFASLLLHEGRPSLADIAKQLGHSVAVLSSTYLHVFEDLRGSEGVSAEDTIRQARAEIAGGQVAHKRPNIGSAG
jgi:integrase